MEKKSFLKRWSEGIKNSTPEQQLYARCVGLIGTVIGLSIALVVMLMRGVWYFGIFMAFMIFLQGVQYIGTRQQYIALKEMADEMKPQQEDIESPKIDEEIGNHEDDKK